MLRDEIDRQIIACLEDDGRASFHAVGKRVGLSAPAVKRRVDRLVEDGVITGFTVLVDPHATGDAARTEAFVELYFKGPTRPDQILASVRGNPEVIAAYTITGDADALVHLRTQGIAELEDTLERIRANKSVERTRSVVVLSRLIER